MMDGPLGETKLFEYGIQTEDSDIRAHVSVVNKIVYVFQTKNAIDAIVEHKPKIVSASQNGVKGITALGWLVKVEWIKDLRKLKCHSWTGWPFFNEIAPTSEKGAMAISLVKVLLSKGRFPLWIDGAKESEEKNIQVLGTDILIVCKQKIQVKCDFRGGDKPLGTGNLFLQKAERNPLRAF